MKILAELTGTTSKNDIQIQKNISHVLIVKTGTTSPISAEFLSAVIKGRELDHVITPTLKVKDLALISQYGNGYMLQEVDADADVKSAFLIQIGNGACIQLYDQEYISLTLEGLQSTATYDVYGFENLSDARSYIKYQSNNIPAGDPTTRSYNLSPFSRMLAIRNNGGLRDIKLTGNNGKQVTYYPEELSAIAREQNGATIGPDKLIEGDSVNQVVAGATSDFFFLPTTDYKSFEVSTNNGVALTFITTTVFAIN